MVFYGAANRPAASGTKIASNVVEMRLVAACYTYFGWFPWSDFEGESFSEEQVCKLTGGQPSGLDPNLETFEDASSA